MMSCEEKDIKTKINMKNIPVEALFFLFMTQVQKL